MTIMTMKRKVIMETEENNSDSESDSKNSLEELNQSSEELSDSREDSDANEDPATVNAGWADSIAKILKTNKPKGKKTLVLSKAKKLTDVRKQKSYDVGFEIQKVDGETKRELITEENKEKSEQPVHKKKKEVTSFRVKPNILHKDRERTLSKIATKGVVQLFNTVKKQQKDIDRKLEDAGPLEVKRDKVLKNIDKREFLNVLMGDKSQIISNSSMEIEVDKNVSKINEEPTWNVLRDDFMMSAKMKDWDKELENEMENEQELETE